MISVKQKITCSLFSFCKMKDKMPGASSLPVIKNFSRLLFQLKLKNEIDFFSPFYFISSFAFCLVFCFLNSLPPLPPLTCCLIVLCRCFISNFRGRRSIEYRPLPFAYLFASIPDCCNCNRPVLFSILLSFA